MDEAAERDAAIRRLKNKKMFRQHLVTYVIVNTFLVIVWALSGSGYFWPAWVMAGWGIGLVFHGWSAHGRRPITEDEIQREMGRSRPGST